MAIMKISNEEVIAKAKSMMKAIQYDRHLEELESEDVIEKEFNKVSLSWVWDRNFREWFAFFGPFALLGFIGYPFDVVFRYVTYKNKPSESNIYEKAEYMDKIEDNMFWKYQISLASSLFDKQYDICSKLKCMAKKNEEDSLQITKEEAESLGIC
jgi:hypothetical protein